MIDIVTEIVTDWAAKFLRWRGAEVRFPSSAAT